MCHLEYEDLNPLFPLNSLFLFIIIIRSFIQYIWKDFCEARVNLEVVHIWPTNLLCPMDPPVNKE